MRRRGRVDTDLLVSLTFFAVMAAIVVVMAVLSYRTFTRPPEKIGWSRVTFYPTEMERRVWYTPNQIRVRDGGNTYFYDANNKFVYLYGTVVVEGIEPLAEDTKEK